MRKGVSFFCFLLFIAFVPYAFSQVPGTLSYQGILVLTDGSAIIDGTHSIEFNFYTAGTGGSTTLTRTISVTTSKGLYTCIIGDGTSGNTALPSTIGSQQFYIGIKVDGGTELTPRAQLTTSAYSFQAQSAYSMDAAGLTGTVAAARIAAGTIDNTKLASGIDAAKVTTGTVAVANGGTGANSATTARTNLGLGSLSTLSAVTSSLITDNEIVNADISTAAAIADTKLATISTAGKVSGNAITSGTIGGSTNMNVTTTGNVIVGSSTNSSTGVVGLTLGGNGVLGQATGSGVGVYAQSQSGYGIYATCATAPAGYFEGSVTISNGLNVSGGGIALGTTYPRLDNSFNLGYSTGRWLAVFAVNGTIQTSDLRLKENISNLKYGLKEILQMQPVSYTWKDKPSSKLNLGLIAQDVLKLTPEVVDVPEGDGFLGMNYAQLIPVLINGIKEQQSQIEGLTENNKNLEHRLQSIEAFLSKQPSEPKGITSNIKTDK